MYLPSRADMDLSRDFQPPGSWLTYDDRDTRPSSSSRYRSAASQSQRSKGSYASRSRQQQRGTHGKLSRDALRDFAELTLDTLDSGSYVPPGTDEPFDLLEKMTYTNDNTEYYAPDDAEIAGWATADLGPRKETKILMKEYSTLAGARELHRMLHDHPEVENKTIGVLNFASAKKPGGGFMNGAQAQEESIARSSTLYPSLITDVATQFYAHYAEDPDNPYYTHAMVYSPAVVLIRNDKGHWKKPIDVDVLTSAAVNAGEVRQKLQWEEDMRLLRARVRAAEEAREREAEKRRHRERERKILLENSKRLKSEEKKRKAEEERLKIEEKKRKAEEDRVKAGEEAKVTTPDEMQLDEDSKGTDVEMKELDAPTVEDQAKSTPHHAETQQDESNPWASVASANTQSAPVPLDPTPTSKPLPETSSTQPDAPQPEPSTSSPPRIPSPPQEHIPIKTLLAMADEDIVNEMRERIGRLLYLFHKRRAAHLVLGAYGTGVFQNNVEVIAGIFFDFLVRPEGTFHGVFESVVFAILGEPTIRDFRKVFQGAVLGGEEGEEGEDGDESDEGEDVQDGKADDVGGNADEPATTAEDIKELDNEPESSAATPSALVNPNEALEGNEGPSTTDSVENTGIPEPDTQQADAITTIVESEAKIPEAQPTVEPSIADTPVEITVDKIPLPPPAPI